MPSKIRAWKHVVGVYCEREQMLQPSRHTDGDFSCCRSPVSVSIPYWTPFILLKGARTPSTLTLHFITNSLSRNGEYAASRPCLQICICTPSLRNHFLRRQKLKFSIAFLRALAQLGAAAGQDWQHRKRVSVLHNAVDKIPSGVLQFLKLTAWLSVYGLN
jgi:hypothetical protein